MPPAPIDDLYAIEGKAELIGGRIITFMPNGYQPGVVALEIVVSLREFARATGQGVALGDSVGDAVSGLSSGRQSFCPDASYHAGPLPANRLRFVNGPPTFAVEVRSENDYGPAANRDMAAKRADDFEAGTRDVWDVDTVAETIRVYRRDQPTMPMVYTRGDTAEAEPAVIGWRIAVDSDLRVSGRPAAASISDPTRK